MSYWSDLKEIPPGSFARRFLYSALLAIGAVLLLHVEVESQRLMLDARARGASREGALALASGLASEGARQVLALAAGVAGLAALVLAASPVFGERASGGAWVLLVGGVLLLALALVLKRFARRGSIASRPDA